MYERFFGLKERPFDITPDPRFFYPLPGHQEALAHLVYGVEERKGFVLLTAEVGMGKTLLLRALLERLGEDVRTAYIFNPRMGFPELLGCACADLGLSVNGQSKSSLLTELNHFLVEGFSCGENAVLIIDEAQNLSASALEEIRLLSNLETSRAKLLQIVLVGQPELEAKLGQPSLRQLRQRIGLRTRLSPLNLAETKGYIQQRMEVAGAQGSPVFTEKALREVYRCSRGIPRLINILCDNALLTAYAEGQRSVSSATIREGARDLGLKKKRSKNKKRVALGAAVFLLSLLGMGAYPSHSDLWDWAKGSLSTLTSSSEKGLFRTASPPKIAPLDPASRPEGASTAPLEPKGALLVEGPRDALPLSPEKSEPVTPTRPRLDLKRVATPEENKRKNRYIPELARWVQEALSRAGYYSGRVTGQLDEATTEALQAFQREKGLDPVGLPGPLTRAALREYALGEYEGKSGR